MPLPDTLLTPLPGDQPCGTDLRYEPLYEKLKEARREDDDAPQGDWERPRKLADWPQVIKLATDALAKQTKDLQIAVWLAEALLRRDGCAGLQEGLTLLHGLVDQFWDHVHPQLEDGDAELRAAPLEWLGTRLTIAVRMVPVTTSGISWIKCQESRTVPSEQDAEQEESKGQARQTAIAEGKLTPEEFDQAFGATPKPWYRQLVTDVADAQAALGDLITLCDDRFGSDAPSFIPMREALEEVRHGVQGLLERKLQLDPDPVDAVAAGGTAGGGGAAVATAVAGGLAPEPVDRADATARLISAARFLRRSEPTSPVSYLALRVLRWGELRALGPEVDPRLLEAPPTHTRSQLKTLLLDQDWSQLLEAAETIMATPAGRGWLDLQRYVLNACAGLGPDFDVVARAIREELRRLLIEIPGLPDMTLMDDMPTAGPSTVSWLREEQLVGEGSGEAPAPAPRAAAPAASPSHDRALERALSEVRAGRTQAALELLQRELERERSPRGRFLRQVQLAKVMLEAGLDSVAAPTLEQLVAQIDTQQLEAWEAGTVVAEPLALLYRCLQRLGGDPTVMQTLYLRLSRLDPMMAITLGEPTGEATAETTWETMSDGESGA
ncbi:MAG: type VI secretion system protein TssA [Gemmatimonadota bacterium]|nr:type VI secretion system protein TssA [Gemmatimonadota bacterium]